MCCIVTNRFVSKGNVSKTSTVAINILDSGCQSVSSDILGVFDAVNYNAVLGPFRPNNLDNDFPSKMDLLCGRLKIIGDNLLCDFCSGNLDTINLQFFPSKGGITGEVKLFPETFQYNSFTTVTGSSVTYDTAAKTITIDLRLEDDFEPYTNKLIL